VRLGLPEPMAALMRRAAPRPDTILASQAVRDHDLTFRGSVRLPAVAT